MLRGDLNSPLSVGLKTAWWPMGFRMPDIKAYKGNTDPTVLLWVYETTIEFAEGDDTTKATSITLALAGAVLTLFFTIPSWSIYVWKQLRDQIYNNFQGKYAEPKDAECVFAIKHAPDESLRNFFKWFVEVKHQVKDVNETTVVIAATCGLQKVPLAKRLAQKPIRTVRELFDIMEE